MSFLLFVIVMLVQNAFPTPTAATLAAVDPYPTIPSELSKLSGWKAAGVVTPKDQDKLENLALIGINKLRTDNGLKENLMVNTDVRMWSARLAQDLCKQLENETLYGIPFNHSSDEQHSRGVVTEYVDYKIEVADVDKVLDPPTSDIVVEVIKKFYNDAQEKVKQGKQIDSLAAFNPKTKYFGFGMSKLTSEWNNKASSYRTVVLSFANEQGVRSMVLKHRLPTSV